MMRHAPESSVLDDQFCHCRRRPSPEDTVTIALGFVHRTGLLLCADTQQTGELKLQASKLMPHVYDDGSKTVFVTVGSARYARMGFQQIEEILDETPKAERTLSKMRQVVTYGIRTLHQEHLFKHPNSPTVQYLIGVWSAHSRDKGKGPILLVTDETAVVRHYGYECLGHGESIGHFLLRRDFKRVKKTTEEPKHTEDEVRALALKAVREIADYDPYVGGTLEAISLYRDGHMTDVSSLAKLTSRGKTLKR